LQRSGVAHALGVTVRAFVNQQKKKKRKGSEIEGGEEKKIENVNRYC
jgi:hypothetical protein